MMTREAILTLYKVNPATGRIESPGKFEGEMLYVPYFWEEFLNGLADEDSHGMLTFKVLTPDRTMFPELKDVKVVQLREDSQGFVTAMAVTTTMTARRRRPRAH